MKRFLCPQHSHLFMNTKRPVTLSTERCTACRWENRPTTLIDLARALEDVAGNLRFTVEQGEDYDPFGITWVGDFEKTIIDYLNMIHESYRGNFLKALKDKFPGELK